ncbi:hypothetical protein J6590_015885 [Homalodisca vitripennis]|nr:hypothetical protein J6590_015885 [Homalodisca vitripennis]
MSHRCSNVYFAYVQSVLAAVSAEERVERKFRRYTTRNLSTRLKEGSNEERFSQVRPTVVYSFVRDSFVFRKERESQPKSQPPGFLEEDTAQRSRQQEVLISTVSKRLRKSSSFFEFLSQQRRVLTDPSVNFNRTGIQGVLQTYFLEIPYPKRKASGKFPGTIFTTPSILKILFGIICSQSTIEYTTSMWGDRMTATLRSRWSERRSPQQAEGELRHIRLRRR